MSMGWLFRKSQHEAKSNRSGARVVRLANNYFGILLSVSKNQGSHRRVLEDKSSPNGDAVNTCIWVA